MAVILIGILIFVLSLGAGLAGLAVQKRLQSEHKSDSARAVVGQIAGLVTLLLALVLGTLVGVSFSYFMTQKAELEVFSTQVLHFDQALKQFGPEAQPLRDVVRQGIEKGYETFWGGGAVDPAQLTVEGPLASSELLVASLAKLQPKTDEQKAALASAKTYAGLMDQSRLLMSLQVASQPVSWVVVAVLVFWTLALFFGTGLFAESNPIVVTALAFGAVSIAFAIFLILELGMPYSGIFRVPPAALEQTLQFMGK